MKASKIYLPVPSVAAIWGLPQPNEGISGTMTELCARAQLRRLVLRTLGGLMLAFVTLAFVAELLGM